MSNFVEKCVCGDSTLDDIHTYIDRWHAGAGYCSLGTFLGFTHEEYGLWIEQPNILSKIIETRKKGSTLTRAECYGDEETVL